MRIAIHSKAAPDVAGAPLSQAVQVGDLLFVSGQLPIDPATGQFNSQNAIAQAEQCLKNVRAIARSAGTDLSKTVKTTVLLTDINDFAEINKVYASYFENPYPARACYQVAALPRGAKVEIEAVISIV